MSYNLLADCLATPEYHPYQSSRLLEFSFRAPRIMQEIAQSGASLICLQEMDHIDDFYEPQFKELGFNLIYGKRKH